MGMSSVAKCVICYSQRKPLLNAAKGVLRMYMIRWSALVIRVSMWHGWLVTKVTAKKDHGNAVTVLAFNM